MPPVLRLSDAAHLTGESSCDPEPALPVAAARTLRLIRQVGSVISRPDAAQSPPGQRVRRIVQEVETLVDREPIRPVSQLVQRFHEVAVDAPEGEPAPRLRVKRAPPFPNARRASDCDFRRRRRKVEEEETPARRPGRSSDAGLRSGEKRSVHLAMRHSNPIYNTM